MTSLCHTCAVEHATDKVETQCTKRGIVKLPVFSCEHHRTTELLRLRHLASEVVRTHRNLQSGGEQFLFASAMSDLEKGLGGTPEEPSRERQLENALRELCEALDGTTTDGGIRVHVAIAKACELIPRKASR